MISVVDKTDVGNVKVIVDADAQLPSFVKVARRERSDSVTYVPIKNIRRLQREKFKLEDENARLRELLRDAWGSGHPSKSCGECEIMDECHEYLKTAPPFSQCLFEERIEERMRELGAEVDE